MMLTGNRAPVVRTSSSASTGGLGVVQTMWPSGRTRMATVGGRTGCASAAVGSRFVLRPVYGARTLTGMAAAAAVVVACCCQGWVVVVGDQGEVWGR